VRVRIDGDRVFRPAHPWTLTVHALLRHLRARGFDRVPEPLGVVDDQEVLRYVPGESGPAGWAKVVPDQGLRAFARLLREYHDATVGFVAPEGATWALPPGPGDEVVRHGDVGPWNAVWRGDAPVALLDFDFARPGTRLDDVAYALEYVAPFRSDEEALRWHAFATPPDRRGRIETFAHAYGLTDTTGLVDAVIAGQRRDIAHVRDLAARGIEPQRTWVAEGHLDDLAARVRWSETHRDRLSH